MIKIETYNPSSKKYVAKYYAKDIIGELKPKIDFLKEYKDVIENSEERGRVYNRWTAFHGNTKNALLKKAFYQSSGSNPTGGNHYRLSSSYSQNYIVIDWLYANLEELIKAKPQRLIELSTDLSASLTGSQVDVLSFIQEVCIPYDDIRGDGIGGWTNKRLVQEIGAKTCYYCNRQYVITVDLAEGKQRTTAQLDHFFPQSKHPILGLSFYNLIPSCSHCNGIKSNIPFKLSTHIHPYLEGFGRDGMWYYDGEDVDSILGQDENFEIKMEPRGAKSAKIEGNLNVFVLRELYDQSHRDLVRELIRKKYAFGNAYLSNLIRTFPAAGLTKKEAYQLLYHNYLDPKDFYKRPLSKLTRDILEQLGVPL